MKKVWNQILEENVKNDYFGTTHIIPNGDSVLFMYKFSDNTGAMMYSSYECSGTEEIHSMYLEEGTLEELYRILKKYYD
jgi:hypothetical protein